MFRIDQLTATGSLPTPVAPGVPGYFNNGNPALGIPATIVDADFLNRLQEELMSLLTAANVTGVKTNYTQVFQAILANAVMYDTGGVNAVVVTPRVPITSLVDGLRIYLVPLNSNTGTTTINFAGLGILNLTRPDGSILQPGDLTAGQRVAIIYVGATNSWCLLSFPARIRLTMPLSLFVNSATGSDTNNGLSSGAAFQTMNRAYNWLQQNVDIGGQLITINCVGTTLAPLLASGPVLGCVSPLNIVFLGNVGSPSSVQVSASNAHAFFGTYGAQFSVKGFQITASGSASPFGGTAGLAACGLLASSGATVITDKMIFGTCNLAHIFSIGSGFATVGSPVAPGSYTVTGGANTHVAAYAGGVSSVAFAAVTLSGTPAFAGSYAGANDLGLIIANGMTIASGTATGLRYSVITNAVIDTNGGGASFFPGGTPGTTGSGGQYN